MDMEAVNRRIAQFETMVRPEADPDNDMAWFSLGGAYRDASRLEESARAFRRVVEINKGFSKAWQMLGQVLADSGQKDAAIAALTEGYTIAAGKGDRMGVKLAPAPKPAAGAAATGRAAARRHRPNRRPLQARRQRH